ncbi:uncharacterized protein LOC130378567 isoform X2 [Gadus chalcogrammus]|uniref:uncharacterized protein LOC130378567 isoform X2 n=1 Tax=Gadus chalcogrammus TaxID=1042646 RepID=UPI0024C2F01C|nr:uncharacterized protein LOC130378567 isoform X2 [Gadus chalcogrammus]
MIIYNLLEKCGLESRYKYFFDSGVTDGWDFIDRVKDDDLNKEGFTQLERKSFENLKDLVRSIRARPDPGGHGQVAGKKEEFSLQYTYPECPVPRNIPDMDPAQNTVEDLMLRICLENVDNSKGVCLFTVDGMPLTDDPFLNTWSLKARHIKDKDILYAIFTPVQNLKQKRCIEKPVEEARGEHIVKCRIMLMPKGNFDISVNLKKDTINDLRRKLSLESEVPVQVLHYQGIHVVDKILADCGISEDRRSTVTFSLSSFHDEHQDYNSLFDNDVTLSKPQTKKGQSVFLALLYSVRAKMIGGESKHLIAYIWQLTGCNPLAQSLYQLISRNDYVTSIQRIAIFEGLYLLFRKLLPTPGKHTEEKPIEDTDVFEYSSHCWAYLITYAKEEPLADEKHALIQLSSEDGHRFHEPVVLVPGTVIFERADIQRKIDGSQIPLEKRSLKRHTDLEKVLLSLPPSFKIYYSWISDGDMLGVNFQVDVKDTFTNMTEKLTEFPFLRVTPPLHLKAAGQHGPLPVLLSEDNLGICLCKNKQQPKQIQVMNFLSGKKELVDLEELASRIGNLSDDQKLLTCRTPKEAILVLMDTSSSMEEECELKMRKIDAVKELFDSFASRTMAYDFYHVIGLVGFSTDVKLLHTFKETLETFKQSLRNLQPNGRTVLYDALQQGVKEMEEVKKRFPDCRLRIICLTDGNNVGSTVKPETVAVNLIKSNIIVDSVLLGKVDNNMLHGISIATGGCCFKPETLTDGLKLFECETVLSLEMRKPRKKLDPSSITSETVLTSIFAQQGYDDLPETSLPSGFNNTVTVAQNAFKSLRSKKYSSMERGKRVLEELRILHCHPHPYFSVFPSDSDFSFWKILMQGPPATPYENGTFKLYCQFGPDYPVKPPTIRFVTAIYHCNINSSGRICHHIFDHGYNAHITMKEILEAVYGLLIAPEAEDALDSILAEKLVSSREEYTQEAKEQTAKTAAKSFDEMEQELVGQVPVPMAPMHLSCFITGKLLVDPVKTRYDTVYERRAIEDFLKTGMFDPQMGKDNPLGLSDLTPDPEMKQRLTKFRLHQIVSSDKQHISQT